MMSDREVIQAADYIEEAVFLLVEMESMMEQNMKIYVPCSGLVIHNEEEDNQAQVLINYSRNSTTYYVSDISDCSVNLGLFTWLKYKIDGKSEKKDNTMLRTQSNKYSMILSTNSASEKVVRMNRGNVNDEFKMQGAGTPECDEYLFLSSLEYDDFTMNALMFQYEWRRRYGRNIVLRIGRDPVQTCSLILQTVKDAYEKYVEYSRDPKNPKSFGTV